MQCKDIPDIPILQFLWQHHRQPCTYGERWSMPTVRDAMPENTPDKLQLAKMRMLIKRGLVKGCPCGCRGDFEITQDGITHLEFVIRGDKRSLLQVQLSHTYGI